MKMQSFALAVFVVLGFGVTSANAQSVKGTNFVNLGIGVGTFGFSGTGGLPITASFEHGFTNEISGGGFASFIKRNFYDDYSFTYYVIGAKASYHLNQVLNVENPKLDVYGGASLFYRGYKASYKDFDPEYDYATGGGNIGIGIHAGGRYMFNNNFGGFAELGYGISPLQLGVTFKF